MEISFLNFNPHSRSGPNSFGHRLASKIAENGHKVYLTPSKLNLIFIEYHGDLPENSKNILRLDGIWTKQDEIHSKNERIKYLYHSCDEVIWQSEYDKNMTISLWGHPKSGVVIPNGATELSIDNNKFSDFKKFHDEVFVCSSNWHKQKRLQENIDFFIKNKSHDRSALVVLGDNPYVNINHVHLQDKNIYFLGDKDHIFCSKMYQISDWMIHLAWRDHCPNVVIEALNQGCPVICSSSGGTKEIVKDNGIIIHDENDTTVDSLIFDYDNPPHLPIEKIQLKKQKINIENVPTLEKSYHEYMKVFKKWEQK